MSLQSVLLPVFVQVALTFGLLFAMGRSRVAAVRRGEVKVRDVALGQRNWPERETQLSNAFDNQFQLPVLFYVLVVLALIARKADLLFVVLSWAFVVLRLAHAAIHITSNVVRRRFYVYLAGALVLLVMWLIVAVRILWAI